MFVHISSSNCLIIASFNRIQKLLFCYSSNISTENLSQVLSLCTRIAHNHNQFNLLTTNPLHFRLSKTTWNFIVLIGLTCLMALLVSSQQPHIAVLENDAQEDLLPIEYRNPFLKTPRVRALLDRSSWFGPGENQVRPPY